MKWTAEDINKTGLKNNLCETINKRKVIAKFSVEKETIKTLLWVLNREKKIPDYVEELEFNDLRKFRFDWAIPELKLAIEYEGIFSKKSRHTTISGFTNDCEKYNLAQIDGWTVLRYTAKNYKDLGKDLLEFIKKRNN